MGSNPIASTSLYQLILVCKLFHGPVRRSYIERRRVQIPSSAPSVALAFARGYGWQATLLKALIKLKYYVLRLYTQIN